MNRQLLRSPAGWHVPRGLRLAAGIVTVPLIAAGALLTVTIVLAPLGLPVFAAGLFPLWKVIKADRIRLGHPAVPMVLLGTVEAVIGLSIRDDAESLTNPERVQLGAVAVGIITLVIGLGIAALASRRETSPLQPEQHSPTASAS